MSYKLNFDIDKATKGAIVVANAPTLLINELGSTIESFNTVIRINSYEIKGYEKHVGTKTDIWTRAKNHEIEVRDGSKFKEVWLKPGWNRGNINGKVAAVVGIPVRNANISNVIDLPIGTFRGKSWTTGFCAIKYALERFDSVTIAGFNFYSNVKEASPSRMRPHYYLKEAPCGYETAKNVILNKDGDYNRHSVLEEREYVENLYKENKLNLLCPREFLDHEYCNRELENLNLVDCVRYIPDHLKNLYREKGCKFFDIKENFDIEKTLEV